MVIDPTQLFVLVELERIRWFLGQLDLTKTDAGEEIQDAYNSVNNSLMHIRKYNQKSRK